MKEDLRETRVVQQPPTARAAREKRKKKYVKPSVIYQAPLEAMAATCTTFPGKAGPATGCGLAFS